MAERYTVGYDAQSPWPQTPWTLVLDGRVIDRFATKAEAEELADEYNNGTP